MVYPVAPALYYQHVGIAESILKAGQVSLRTLTGDSNEREISTGLYVGWGNRRESG